MDDTHLIFKFLSHETQIHVAMGLYSYCCNRLQKTSKWYKNFSDTLDCTSCATSFFLWHGDVICDLSLVRCTAMWNLFVNFFSISFNIATNGLWEHVVCYKLFSSSNVWWTFSLGFQTTGSMWLKLYSLFGMPLMTLCLDISR